MFEISSSMEAVREFNCLPLGVNMAAFKSVWQSNVIKEFECL